MCAALSEQPVDGLAADAGVAPGAPVGVGIGASAGVGHAALPRLCAAARAAYDGLPDPIWVYDISGQRMHWANRAAVAAWNAESLDALLARSFASQSETTRTRLTNYLRGMADGKTYREQWTLYPAGKPTPFDCVCSGIVLEAAAPDQDLAMLVMARTLPTTSLSTDTLRMVEALRYTGVMISLYDLDGVPLMRNPAATAQLGDAGPDAPRLTGQFRDGSVTGRMMETIARGETFSGEALVWTMAGWRWHGLDVRRVFDPATGGGALLVNQRDIEDRRAAQQELAAALAASREARGRLHAILAQTPVGLAILHTDHTMRLVNPAFCTSLGRDEPALIGHTLRLLMPSDQAYAHFEAHALRRALEGVRVHDTLELVHPQDGSRWYHLTLCPVTPERPDQGVVLTLEDASRRVESEHRLRVLTQAVEQSPAAIVITDPNGSIEYVNAAFSRNTGYTAAEAIGQNPRILQGGEKSLTEYQSLWDTITAGHTWTGEFHNRRKDGSLYWEKAQIAPVREVDGGISHFVGVKEDITVLRHQTDELHAAIDRLTAANGELERFAYVASHDLRAPLRTIASFAQLLERRHAAAIGGEGAEFVAIIVEAVRRMDALLTDLLNFSRAGQPGPLTRISTAAACTQAMENLREAIAQAGAGLEIGPLPDVIGDDVQLIQVFQNVIANALKFRRPGIPPRIRIGGQATARGVLVVVADNGVGIGTTTQDVFEIFRRLHPPGAYPGTGVGLAICKRVIQRLGGRIWYEPNTDGGTTFLFTLPSP